MFSWLRMSRTPMKDNIEEFAQTEKEANAQGILPPKEPNPMQCAPDPKGMLDAVADGLELGEQINEAMDNRFYGNVPSMDQYLNIGWSTLFKVGHKFAIDTFNAQECLDNQNEVYSQQMQQYEENIKTFVEQHSTPVSPPEVPELKPELTLAQAKPASVTAEFDYARFHGMHGVYQDKYGNPITPGGYGGTGRYENSGDQTSSGRSVEICIELDSGHKSCSRYSH